MNSPSMNRASLSASQLGTIVIRALLALALLAGADRLAAQDAPGFLTSRPRAVDTKPALLSVGGDIATTAGQRQRLQLPDGSILFVNERTTAKLAERSQLKLTAGEIFVESAGKPLVVLTPHQEISGRSSHFDVRVDKNAIEVIVARGTVQVSLLPQDLGAGQKLVVDSGGQAITPAPPLSHALDWTRALVVSRNASLVPGSEHAGGDLIAVDPHGQEAKLELRKLHVDVVIEDGFARTTIDQTFFNHETAQMEGTFYFPLPGDASLSRLAMYVDGKLMEGGMMERDLARRIYDDIRWARRDPALLEWVDGSTFKMRVFPIEGRQEKRIILSYTQKLTGTFGDLHYRFPAGHSLRTVRDWSFEARVKNGTKFAWSSSCDLKPQGESSSPGGSSRNLKPQGESSSPGGSSRNLKPQGESSSPGGSSRNLKPQGESSSPGGRSDLVLRGSAKNARTDRDVVLSLSDPSSKQDAARFSSAADEQGNRYLMVRYSPELAIEGASAKPQAAKNWAFLFEASGDRDPLLTRVQIEVMRHLLSHAGENDTFTVLAANTRVRLWSKELKQATPENVAAAVAFLEGTHLIGALDLGQALGAAETLLKQSKNSYLVHLGSGVAAMGERREDVLAKRIPQGTRYVGVGVGRHWARSFMKAAAERSGGQYTQINPDEAIAWRSFELFAGLNTPQLLNAQAATETRGVRSTSPRGLEFLSWSQSLAQGEELCAIARLTPGLPMPGSVTISGLLDGKPWSRELEVKNVTDKADYLPRTWAKLEIDRLLAEDSTKNKDAVVALSKAMYVMTPFTSLLVLENDDMYTQYKVERGRKDHWAMYPCPPKIDVVYEPLDGEPNPKTLGAKLTAKQVLRTIAGCTNVPEESNLGVGRNSSLPMTFRDPFLLTEDLGPAPADENQPFGFFAGFYNGGGGRKGVWEERGFKNANSDYLIDMGGQAQLDVVPILRPGATFGKVSQRIVGARDLTVDISGVSTGSLMFGAGIPSNSGLMGSIVLHDRAMYRMGGAFQPDVITLNGVPMDLPMVSAIPGMSRLQNLKYELALGVSELYQWSGDGKSNTSGLRSALLYRRPSISMPPSVFFDLVAYAPGMSTNLADVEAVIEAEARPLPSNKAGKIDEAARKLLDKARGGGWRSWTVDVSRNDKQAFTIYFNGAGKYNYERELPPGIREKVVCDGTTLLHFYPSLGIGAKRQVSRFHRADLAELVPWFVPSAEDLAHGADLKAIGDRTVALIPHKPRGEVLRTPGVPSPDKSKPTWLEVHLVFAADGRLAERQWVRVRETTSEIVYRQVCGSDGVVQVLDGKGKELAVTRGKLANSAFASRAGDSFEGLVVLTLPYRTAEHVRKTLKIENKEVRNLSFAEALPLFAAEFAAGNSAEANKIFRQVFHAKEQRQLGYYVLLAACGLNLDSENGDVLAEHLDNPVAQYLALHTSPVLRKHAAQWALNSNQWKEGFLQHLALTHALLQRWENDKLLKGDPAKVAAEKVRALEYVRRHKGTAFAWALLSLMQDRANQELAILAKKPATGLSAFFNSHYVPTGEDVEKNRAFHAALAECWELFKDVPGLGYAARYEAARSTFFADKTEEARKRFETLYADTLKRDRLPAIDADFRAVLQGTGANEPWSQLMNETALRFAKNEEHRPAILALARQCWQLDDQQLAQHLLTLADSRNVNKKEAGAMKLAVILFLQEMGQTAQADELLRNLLSDPKQAQRPELWRLASTLAEKRDMPARAIECLEKALDLEFRGAGFQPAEGSRGQIVNLPHGSEVVDLRQVRREYGQVLSHYQALADAMTALKIEPPGGTVAYASGSDGFPAKVLRTADRWRALDPDSAEVCQTAAQILQRLGDRDLAFDYLTTPIGRRPNEAEPWVELANNLSLKGELKLADRAYQAAFEAEPTNAQILWDRAQNLHQAGEMQSARRLFRQLADGNWPQRFQGIQTQARLRSQEN